MIRSNAQLSIAYVWSHIYSMQFGRLERYLSIAMAAVEAGKPDRNSAARRAEVMALRAVYESVYGDADKAMSLAHEAAPLQTGKMRCCKWC